MARLPILSGAEVAKCFQQAGWRIDRQKGSHVILVKIGHVASLSVPQHKEIAPGTLRGLIRAAGKTVDKFVSLTK
jgi:predicted RNA binding protein YcfA (HicA-like mRNA interferase family)